MTKLKLWILKPSKKQPKGDDPWNPWYDKVFGFIVRAESEAMARQYAHREAGSESTAPWESKIEKYPWLDENHSTCEELKSDGNAGVVMIDFNAA